MLNLIKVEVPAAQSQDSNPSNSVWVDGKLRILRGSRFDTFFIKHENREVADTVINEAGEEEVTTRTAVYAFPIEVEKPATYDMAVDAAERAAYNLNSDREANSFSASLSRKFRLSLNGEDDSEVVEHDAFIEEVKAEIKPLFQ